MLAGDDLSFGGRRRVDAALATAERVSELDFAAYVGAAGDNAREHALALHSHLERPERSVLVLCDPAARALEIVTGSSTRQFLDDTACRLAVATMTSSFLAGDVVGGLVRGIQQLGEAAHHPETLHAV
ncbi:MAG TPA: DUF5130 family protein [Microlunatus sp.]|nr:DUF5130 family protein [Microlunatus sp.]